MFSTRSFTVNEISEAGISDKAIENMKADTIPSEVLSKPFTDYGRGNGKKVNSILFE